MSVLEELKQAVKTKDHKLYMREYKKRKRENLYFRPYKKQNKGTSNKVVMRESNVQHTRDSNDTVTRKKKIFRKIYNEQF